MAEALAGKTGHGVLVDYRGTPVFAAYAPVPALGVGVVSKVDVAYVRAPFIRVAVGSVAVYGLLLGALAVPTFRQSAQLRSRLRAAEGRFEALVAASPIAVLEADTDGACTYVNGRWCELSGLRPDESMGTGWTRAIQADDRAHVQRAWTEFAAGREPFLGEFRVNTPEGMIRWVRGQATRIREDQGVVIGLSATMVDITAARDAQTQLQETAHELECLVAARTAELASERDLLRRYLDVADVIMVVIRADETVAMINRRGCEILGYEESELQGKPWFATCIPPRLRDEMSAGFSSLMAGESELFEYNQNPVLTKNGVERTIAWHNAVLREEDGRIYGTLSSGEDITEKLALEAQVRQSEKLAAVGQLTAGLAHEIGTPLSIISGRAESMLGKMASDDPLRGSLEGILKQIDRIVKLVSNLNAFAGSRPSTLRPVTVAPLVRDVISLVAHQVRDHEIEVTVECADDVPAIVADANQVQQVLLNLVVNSIQAMPDHGRLTIRAGRTVARRYREDPVKDRYVKVEVTDTGEGIAQEHLAMVFDPFFTTKDVGKGTGLGLAVSSRIAQSHGGWLRAKSRKGEGATFSVFWPVADGEAGPAGVEAAARA